MSDGLIGLVRLPRSAREPWLRAAWALGVSWSKTNEAQDVSWSVTNDARVVVSWSETNEARRVSWPEANEALGIGSEEHFCKVKTALF